jgi:hypothetical protein
MSLEQSLLAGQAIVDASFLAGLSGSSGGELFFLEAWGLEKMTLAGRRNLLHAWAELVFYF